MDDFSALRYLKNIGLNSLKTIQEQSIKGFEKNNNIILFSKTGSGKTLSFLLSIISKLKKIEKEEVQALIISPSRELCIQINDVFKSLKSGYKSTVCYGGHSIEEERKSLSITPTIIIGTPGRLNDHIYRKNIKLHNCSFLVIDEFDKCMEFGFNNEMKIILNELSSIKYKMLVSATKMKEIPNYIEMNKAFIIDNIKGDNKINIREHIVKFKGDGIYALGSLLKSFKNERSMVFCNYREVTEDISFKLKNRGIINEFYHGGLEQNERERALIKFKNGSTTILICTDLGSRGLDIPEINHILHYQFPSNEEAFIHRKGRTARMSASGNSYLLVQEGNKLPIYIKESEHEVKIIKSNHHTIKPKWNTLYISGGKKDKINKIDIVGFLSKKGELDQEDIGIITVLDRSSYVAVNRSKTKNLLNKINKEKIKGKKLKIEIAL